MNPQIDTPYVLRCDGCGAEVPADVPEPRCSCASEGAPLIVELDLEAAARSLSPGTQTSRPATLHRFQSLLPFLEGDLALSPQVSPLVSLPLLAGELGLQSLEVKDESRQPAGSLKARPSAIAAARARHFGFGTIACASSGNAAISMAAMAAAEGLEAVAFVSDRIPAPKLARLQAHGPRVVLVRGPYESAYELCQEACAEYGWYNRNCAQNPFLVEGKKTCGLEIAEQSSAHPPDWVVVPVGDGCTIAGIWKGLLEAALVGIAPGTPKLLAVQAESAAPIHYSWAERVPLAEAEIHFANPASLADSIAVQRPRNGARAIAAIDSSGGAAIVVDDESMVAATAQLAQSGLLLEAASASTLAGVRAARESGLIEPGSKVILVGTGSGREDVDQPARRAAQRPVSIEPDLGSLRRVL